MINKTSRQLITLIGILSLTLVAALATASIVFAQTETPEPTATETETLEPTATETETLEPTATETETETPEPTATETETPEPTATVIPAATRTPSAYTGVPVDNADIQHRADYAFATLLPETVFTEHGSYFVTVYGPPIEILNFRSMEIELFDDYSPPTVPSSYYDIQSSNDGVHWAGEDTPQMRFDVQQAGPSIDLIWMALPRAKFMRFAAIVSLEDPQEGSVFTPTITLGANAILMPKEYENFGN